MLIGYLTHAAVLVLIGFLTHGAAIFLTHGAGAASLKSPDEALESDVATLVVTTTTARC